MSSSPPSRAPEPSVEELELRLLLTAVAEHHGYDFRQYAHAPLKRRVRRALQTEHVKTISGLQERLLHDPGALRRFISVLSVHVTSMFRDPTFYRALRERVAPLLRTYPAVHIWVAGCATGEEVYSLAILLEECGLYNRCRIYATDISDDLLEQAGTASFPLERMQAYTQNYLAAGGSTEFSSYYRVQGRRAFLRSDLKRNVVLSQHNLAVDGPFNEFQLILCRNVIIYFNQDLRERVHRLMLDSLCRFGVLGLGMRESTRFTAVNDSYEPLVADQRLYRRVG